MSLLSDDYKQDTADLCAAAAARGVKFPVGEVVFLGRSASGLLTVARAETGDTVPWVWFVTDCCAGAAKGGDSGIYCKGCYEDVDPIYGDVYTKRFHGDVTPPTAEDEAFIKAQFQRQAEEAARLNAEFAERVKRNG